MEEKNQTVYDFLWKPLRFDINSSYLADEGYSLWSVWLYQSKKKRNRFLLESRTVKLKDNSF